MKVWHTHLARCLKLGVSDEGLLIDLDEILAWFDDLGRDGDEFSCLLLEHYGDKPLRARFEEVFEQLVITHSKKGQLFPPELGAADAKKRHHQLTDLFHPNRGKKDDEWLNHRKQLLDIAYESYCNRDSHSGHRSKHRSESTSESLPSINLIDFSAVSTNQPVKKVRSRRSNQSKAGSKPGRWRASLDAATALQRKFIYGAVSVFVFLILFFYVTNFYPVKNVTAGKASPLPTAQDSTGSVVRALPDNSISLDPDTLYSARSDAGDVDAPSSGQLSGEKLQGEGAHGSIIKDSEEGSAARLINLRSENLTVDQPGLSEGDPDKRAGDATADLTQPEQPAVSAVASEPLPNNAPAATMPANPALQTSDAVTRSGADIVSGAKPISKQDGVANAAAVSGQAVSADANTDCSEPVDPQIFPKAITGQIKVGALRLRAGPSKECATISYMAKGVRVELLRCDAAFYWCYAKVIFDSGLEVYGWVSDRFIEHDDNVAFPVE